MRRGDLDRIKPDACQFLYFRFKGQLYDYSGGASHAASHSCRSGTANRRSAKRAVAVPS